jgi:hypothetical protein
MTGEDRLALSDGSPYRHMLDELTLFSPIVRRPRCRFAGQTDSLVPVVLLLHTSRKPQSRPQVGPGWVELVAGRGLFLLVLVDDLLRDVRRHLFVMSERRREDSPPSRQRT